MAPTNYYVDPSINANSGTGTSGDPYGDLQYALNTITRDSTNGDQINIKAGTAEVLAAALTLATYGTPTETAPLILRGYTSAAGDGGIGEIDCNGYTFWTSTSYTYWILADLKIHNFGNNHGIQNASFTGYIVISNCEVYKGASTPSSKYLVNISPSRGLVIGCNIHDAGTSGRGVSCGDTTYVLFNYINNCPTAINGGPAIGNVINLASGGTGVTAGADFYFALGNSIY